MKTLGLILVVLGTSLAAAFGAQNAEPVQSQQEIAGRARVLTASATRAFAIYCAVLPEGARTAAQTEDGCQPPPVAGGAAEVDRRRAAQVEAVRALGSAHKAVVHGRELYCDSAVDGALTPSQEADGCPPVKAVATAEQAEVARLDLVARREALTVLELSAQELRVAYCELGLDGAQTPEQYADLCPPPRTEGSAADIAGARAAWRAAWEPVQAARDEVTAAVAAYCRLEVGGRVIAQQQNEGCAPVKVARTAAEVDALRAEWQTAAENEERATAAAAAADAAFCDVVAGGAWDRHQQRVCAPLPVRANAAAAAAARVVWQGLVAESARAREATKYAASRVAAGERVGGWFARAGLGFLGGVLLILLGAFLARRAIKAELVAAPSAATPGARPAVDLGVRLDEMGREILALRERVIATTAPTHHDLEVIKRAIERIQNEELEPVIETRSQLVTRYGVGGFADVFGPLSGGERYLNRAWVSLVDRYWEETASSLESAAAHFAEAKGALDQLAAPASGAA